MSKLCGLLDTYFIFRIFKVIKQIWEKLSLLGFICTDLEFIS